MRIVENIYNIVGEIVNFLTVIRVELYFRLSYPSNDLQFLIPVGIDRFSL